MSAPSKQSRWGSLLSQAVAGVEARLDTILAEDDSNPAQKQQPPSRPASAATTSRPAPSTTAKSANDRLQERLARAVAAKNAGTGSPRSEASPARASAELSSASRSPRPSSELARPDSPAQTRSSLSKDEPEAANDVKKGENQDGPEDGQQAQLSPTVNGERMSIESLRPSTYDETPYAPEPMLMSVPVISTETVATTEVVPVSTTSNNMTTPVVSLYEQRIAELEKSLEETQAQHQEELYSRVEQLDALRAKLQYLAREATEASRKDASVAPAGSLEKKLAEKDQQVAQLMEEGQKLAVNEQKLRTAIKKLRSQIAADEKELNEQKIWRHKAETELTDLRETARGLDDLRKASDDAHRAIAQLKRELDRTKSTLASKDETISNLKSQLREESERASTMSAKVNDQVREANQQKVKELEDTIAAMELEKSLAADRAKTQSNELREKAERAMERSRAVELEMKAEVQILESKLEAVRATAEEASSGAVGDAQAKLLRQIETLQTQYSVASENWQGMEASLLSRAANLERERDEALRRESDMRRKARESVSAAKPSCLRARSPNIG
jgi:TATA element modulatory factor